MTIFRFNLFRRSSLLSLSLGGNVMRANFPEYRWLCGRGERRDKMAANQQSKWRPISLSLRTFTHHRLSIYWRVLSLSRHAADRQDIFIFFSPLTFFFISFFICISCSSFFLLSLPFICLSFFLSFVSLLFNIFLLFSRNVYFLPCTHVMFFSCEIVFNFFPILI
jgi:hypothetical protein